ncbi:hypothetical protein [uncultured Tateyamaria sp.]|uniref:hypothetical protein n=1 Tax=uncultured Tateyamaria sp. TaxID=455651 RepID=UPI0026069A85|nr:hypothetical protein [uncultured Tateyamaria sp.]
MAYLTQTQPSFVAAIWNGITGFFTSVSRALTISAAMDARMQRIEALNAKTDEELAAMNLRRTDITAYVFRDLMHV